MKCPKCGHNKNLKLGRKRSIDDARVLALRKAGHTMDAIAKQLKVTRQAIQFSLKRSQS